MKKKLLSHDDLLSLLANGKHVSIYAHGVYQRFTLDWVKDNDTTRYKVITTNGMFFRVNPVYPN